jgi:hypothetical protein
MVKILAESFTLGSPFVYAAGFGTSSKRPKVAVRPTTPE